MEQHAVPQQIAAFKFKLFGNLTTKQFITLAIPLGLAALIFFSPLPPIIRLPLSLVIGIFAFVIAIIPIGGRPADQWALAFVRAISSPTQRIWIKEKEIPEFLNIAIQPFQVENIPQEVTRMSREKLTAYLKSLPKGEKSQLDSLETLALNNIDFGYTPLTEPAPAIVKFTETPAQIKQPANVSAGEPTGFTSSPLIQRTQPLKIQKVQKQQEAKADVGSVRAPIIWHTQVSSYGGNYNYQIALEPPSARTGKQSAQKQTMVPKPSLNLKASASVFQRPTIAPHARPYVVKGVEKRIEHSFSPTLQPQAGFRLASDNFGVENIIPVRTWDNKIKFVHGIGQTRARKLHFGPPEGFDLSRLPIRGEKRFEVSRELKKLLNIADDSPDVVLPVNIKTAKKTQTVNPAKKIVTLPKKTGSVAKSTRPLASVGERVIQPKFAVNKPVSRNFVPEQQIKNLAGPKAATSLARIIPLTDTPNVISGMVTDAFGITISGAVMVIRDSVGIPVRALKTNKLGQFLSATPLAPGKYTIETECDLQNFEPISIEVKNQVFTPIEIRAAQKINPAI